MRWLSVLPSQKQGRNMAPYESRGVEVIMTMTAFNGDKLELVGYPSSGCGLLRSGVAIPEMTWIPCQMDRCTAELLRLGNATD
jgi:hypothetical protein